MPDLAEKLRFAAARVAQDNPAFAALSSAFVMRLQRAGAGLSAPSVGEVLPPFLLPDTSGRLRGLAELAGATTVVVFLRGHWCSFCTAHAEALLASVDQFRARNAHLVLITPERSCYAAVFEDPRITVLCDMDSGYAASLGLAVAMDPIMADHLRNTMGDDVEMFNGSGWVLPMPVVFVLDGRGVVHARFLDPDYRTRASVKEILAALP